MANCNATTLLEEAKCFQCLSKKELQAVVAQLLCNISVDGAGNATITTAQVWAAAGVPAHTPTVTAQVYFDTSTGVQWNWFNGVWN